MQQIVDVTNPHPEKDQQAGKVRFIGFSGLPAKDLPIHLRSRRTSTCVLSYNQYTLQNTRFLDESVPYLKIKKFGVMNAGPFSARLLTNAPLPRMAQGARSREAGGPARLPRCVPSEAPISPSWPFSSRVLIPISPRPSPAAPTPPTFRNWATWLAEPLDEQLLREVQAIFAPVKNRGHP
jgi:hypothetical protein